MKSRRGTLTLYVVFANPSDHPDHFVVRQQHVAVGGVVMGAKVLADSLEAARRAIPRGLVCMERSPDDPPSLVEVWL